jgi:ABC-2 type transport system permease protein
LRGAALEAAILLGAITLFALGNGALSQSDWELEWLATLPIPLSTLLGTRIAIRALLNPFGIYGLWPFLSVIAWQSGYRLGAPFLALGATVLLLLIVATVQTVVDTGLRLRLSPPQLRNLQATLAIVAALMLFLAMSASSAKSYVLRWAPLSPAWSFWLPSSLAVQAIAGNETHSIALAFGALTAEMASVVAVGMVLLGRLLRYGVVTSGVRESGRREHARPAAALGASAGRRLLTPIQARELRLLGRDRNFLVQTLVMPALILGAQVFFNTSGTAFLATLSDHPEHLAAAAFAVSAYALMFSAFQTLNAEGQALWILYCVPQSLASILRQKGYLWAFASLVYPIVIFGSAAIWGGMASLPFLGLAVIVILGAPIFAVIAISLGVFACDPLAPTVDRRVSQSHAYLYLIVSSIYVYALYASTVWQRGALMLLTALFAFALWQRAQDHLPYLLDPAASPPSRVTVSDGIMAALLMFVLQALVMQLQGLAQRSARS